MEKKPLELNEFESALLVWFVKFQHDATQFHSDEYKKFCADNVRNLVSLKMDRRVELLKRAEEIFTDEIVKEAVKEQGIDGDTQFLNEQEQRAFDELFGSREDGVPPQS